MTAFNYKSLKDHVYQYLYEKINNDQLKPKDKINESQLCKDIEVSRTPIREALIQLEDEGYIERVPRRGFIVKEISAAKIKEICQILGCLDGFAAALAIDRMKERDLQEMKSLVGKMDEAISDRKIREYFRLQRDFHDVYVSMCGNRELFDLITSLKKRFVKKAYYLNKDEADLVKSLEWKNNGHKRILGRDVQTFLEKNRMPVPSFLEATRRNVLLVSDDASGLRRMADSLSSMADIAVKTAGPGMEAGVASAALRPALIVVDVQDLEKLSRDFLPALRMAPGLEATPILAVLPAGAAAGKNPRRPVAQAVYSKPVEPERFREAVARLLSST